MTAQYTVVYVERVTGIEPAFSAWEADVLPLNYTRNLDQIIGLGDIALVGGHLRPTTVGA